MMQGLLRQLRDTYAHCRHKRMMQEVRAEENLDVGYLSGVAQHEHVYPS